MITYIYWGLIFALVIGVIIGIGLKMDNLKPALVLSAIILFIAWAAYYFYLQQIFVKRWGGVMSISVPSGQYHIATTWKDDNLWVENYDLETNKCVFSEYSKGNLLQGRVIIKNCNPIKLMSQDGLNGKVGPAAPSPSEVRQGNPTSGGKND